MTVKQIEECRSATVAHKPRERTRTHSAPYSYAVRTCGPTCSCDIFGLESHSKSRLTACTGMRSTNESNNHKTVAINVVDTSLVEEQSTSTNTESFSKIIEDVQTVVVDEVIDSNQALVQNKQEETPKISKPKTVTYAASAKISPVVHPVQELLETEQDYVENLVILVEVFLRRLIALPWITQEQKDTVSRNAEDILKFQLSFLDLLETACEQSVKADLALPIAECFIEMGNGFSIYTEYCIQHESALNVCRELSSKVEWQMFEHDAMAEAEHSSPQRKLQFQDFLIKPVQRICRYQLLLKEIWKMRPKAQQDVTELQEALRIMHSVVNTINNEKQKRDVTLMTNRFIERLEGDWRLNKRSLQLLGNVIYSGALEMLSLHQMNQKIKYYGCFLFSTYMVIVRAKKSTVYEPKHWFPLRQFSLQTLQDNDGHLCNSWLLVSGQHVFEFGASCPQEKQVWIKAIQGAIASLNPEEHVEAIAQARERDEWPEDMLVSSLEEGIKSPSPKLRSRSLANIKDAASATASWKQICIKSPQSVAPKQSYSTPSSVANTPRLSQEVLFSKNIPDDVHSESGSYSETYSAERKESSEMEARFVMVASPPSGGGYLSIDSPGKGKFKSPKSAHKESRKAVVDQKLFDVSTQEVLTAKALSAREKGMMSSRTRRLSFGKGPTKPLTLVDVRDHKNTKESLTRRQSHEIVVKKLRPRSSDIQNGSHHDSYSSSVEINTRSSSQLEEQPLTNKEIDPVSSNIPHGFFEKVIDKFSAISSPHRHRPPAIKTNLPRVVRSDSLKMLQSASTPTSASSASSVGIDAHSDTLNSPIGPSDRSHSEWSHSDIIIDDDKVKRTKRSSQPAQCDREGSKLPSWMRTPVSRRRRDSKTKQ
ncbi:hypothetical protein K450DRAFT_274006 [Umbelopsis ramanniana AG]|uniref:DH domain-containing protein n=1 Tax=Umbelopsis ramanniana AG TaxID=1314678 RepID=A0AAD5E6N3_UMBRA|nr:uncharacterized protein K450DRAFT_274006 [Umbelopsis ramanniana AG]KAI8577271.1 hypothetical protein K450DRAFT_274006 [Umbelopsis ramanniana AG]